MGLWRNEMGPTPCEAGPERSDLMRLITKVKDVPGVAVVTLSDQDQQRNPIVNRILEAVG